MLGLRNNCRYKSTPTSIQPREGVPAFWSTISPSSQLITTMPNILCLYAMIIPGHGVTRHFPPLFPASSHQGFPALTHQRYMAMKD